MTKFDSIVKFRKREMDDMRRELGELQAQEQEAIDRINAHDKAVEAEKQASTETMVGMSYGAFAQASLNKREQLVADYEEKRMLAEEKREIVREAFQELKKFEIARDQALEVARIKEARREQMAFDEIAIQKHVRKHS